MIDKPNTDAANDGSLPGGLEAFISSWVRDNLDDQLPAVVVSYDGATNRAVLRPLVMIGTTDGKKVSRGTIENIPVFRYGAGGFFQRFPVKTGDFGWIKANDRDISLVLQRGGQQDWPNTKRRHNFSDAMFYPDTIKGWTVAGEDADSMTIQSLNGAIVFAMSDESIEMRVGAQVIRLDSSGLTHNGTNIGDTHAHAGSPTAPNGPVSDTGAPLP